MEGTYCREETIAITADRHKLCSLFKSLTQRLQLCEILSIAKPVFKVFLLGIFKEAVVRIIIFLIILNKLKVINIVNEVLLVALLCFFVFFLNASHRLTCGCESSHFHVSIDILFKINSDHWLIMNFD
jgi:hypothetical protein